MNIEELNNQELLDLYKIIKDFLNTLESEKNKLKEQGDENDN